MIPADRPEYQRVKNEAQEAYSQGNYRAVDRIWKNFDDMLFREAQRDKRRRENHAAVSALLREYAKARGKRRREEIEEYILTYVSSN
jgi:hypothetical protein